MKSLFKFNWSAVIVLSGLMITTVSCEKDKTVIDEVTVVTSSRGAFASDLSVQSGQEPRDSYYSNIVYDYGFSVPVYRAYFSFDLSAEGGIVTKAVLRVYNPEEGYVSEDPSETVNFYEVTTSAEDLLTPEDNDAITTDLGDGTLFGSIDITAADNASYSEIELNEDAIAAINLAIGSGTWSVGTAITTGHTETSHTIERVWDGASPSQPDTQLALTIER